PQGSGIYKLTAQPGADLTYNFDRNAEYWDRSHVYPAHVTYVNKLVDDNARLNAIREGVIDQLNISAFTYNTAKNDPAIQIENILSLSPYVINMNNKLAPLDKPEVRRAINIGLNRPAFASALNGLCKPVGQPFGNGVVGYDKKLDAKYDLA